MTAQPPHDTESLKLLRRPWLRRFLLACAALLTGLLFVLSLLPLPSIALADTTGASGDPLEASVERFLMEQTTSLGDQVSVEVRESPANLGPCASPQPFLPRPGVPQGRVTVGVRCDDDGTSRTRYVQATVSATVRHLVARETIEPGERIDAAALGWQESDITRLRRGYLDALPQAAGMVATRRIPSGATLTENMVRQPWLVKRGDTVVLTAAGQGFRISRSVEALENGGLGSTIRLKTESNQVLQGKVTGPDQLSVDF